MENNKKLQQIEKVKLIVDYTQAIIDKLHNSNISNTDAVISHIERVYRDYEHKINIFEK